MNMQLLLTELERISERSDKEWLAGLDERKRKELEFHDQYRDLNRNKSLPQDTYEKLYGNKKFYQTVALSSDYVGLWIEKHCKNKIFLDYACGNGNKALKAAEAGAALAIGLDISQVSVQNARSSAAERKLANTFFLQGDSENTGLPDNCIEVAICHGILHHLDLTYALYELRRILKPGGVILVVEALDYNPFIKFYRNVTPAMRTEWEKKHILSYKDIDFASRFFVIKDIRHWHLFSIAGAFSPRLLPFFNSIDKFFLKMPFIKLMSWMFTFEMHKKG